MQLGIRKKKENMLNFLLSFDIFISNIRTRQLEENLLMFIVQTMVRGMQTCFITEEKFEIFKRRPQTLYLLYVQDMKCKIIRTM